MAHNAGVDLLSRIRIVLVEPQGPLNVGSVARAMANFGLRELVLVKGVSTAHPQAKDMASGAQELLASARQVPDLATALAGCTFVLGTTGKPRQRLPTLRPPEAAERVLDEAVAGQVAIIFGREDHGLTGDELRVAHAVMAIPTAPECRSLNLAQATLLLAWEIFDTALRTGRTGRMQVSHSATGRCIDHEVRARLQGELLQMMRTVGILNEGNSLPVERSIERILALGPMQTRDARLLFALARRINPAQPGVEPGPRPEADPTD